MKGERERERGIKNLVEERGNGKRERRRRRRVWKQEERMK